MWLLIRDAENYYACDSIRGIWMTVALKADSTVMAKNDVIRKQQTQISIGVEAFRVSEKRLDNQFEFTKALRKENRKLKVIAVGSGLLAVLALLL